MEVEGSLINVRIIAVLSGGILFGPWVGICAGLISGIHRYAIDIDGYTSLPCLISSISAGLLATWIHLRSRKENFWWYGILAGMLCEGLTMLLIVWMLPQHDLAMQIVQVIAFPMIAGTVSIGLIIKMVQSLDDKKDLLAARQAKLALDIANKTLPYFRQNNRDSLEQVCVVFRNEIGADAVAITDTEQVLAYVGIGGDCYKKTAAQPMSAMTGQVVSSGQFMMSNDLNDARFCSLLIIPIIENEAVTGCLKIYYQEKNQISHALHEMAVGLSNIISTQMAVSRIEDLKRMTAKAEMTALQSKINPHFLFNAMNAVSSLIRTRPDEARHLIANLADYLRYNLERSDQLIDIQEALEQVKIYIAIEQARFGPKLKVLFDVDAVHIKIPCLLIQPLVENAILHGIQSRSGPGQVTISVKQRDEMVKVSIVDTGKGICQSVIDKLMQEQMASHSIGLLNVHQRVRLLYGEGLHIRRLQPGTEVSFTIPLTAAAEQ